MSDPVNGYRLKVWEDMDFPVVDNFYRKEDEATPERDFKLFVDDMENRTSTGSKYTKVQLLEVNETIVNEYPSARILPKAVKIA